MLPSPVSTNVPGSGISPPGIIIIRKLFLAMKATVPGWLVEINELLIDTAIRVAVWPAGMRPAMLIPAPKLQGCTTPGFAARLKETLALLVGRSNGTTFGAVNLRNGDSDDRTREHCRGWRTGTNQRVVAAFLDIQQIDGAS